MDNRTFLTKVKLFKGLLDSDLDRIALIAREERVGAGSVVIAEGSTGAQMFLVKSGTIDVIKTIPVSWGHEDIRIARLTEGECVGEMALFDNKRRSSTVKAFSDCVLLSLEHAHIDDLISTSPAVGLVLYRNIIEKLCLRVRDASDAVRDLSQPFFH